MIRAHVFLTDLSQTYQKMYFSKIAQLGKFEQFAQEFKTWYLYMQRMEEVYAATTNSTLRATRREFHKLRAQLHEKRSTPVYRKA